MKMRELDRSAAEALSRDLRIFPAVCIVGPRQAGKTTLARRMSGTGGPRTFVTLDEAQVLAQARGDPEGFIEGLSLPAAVDEIQRAPDLLLPIKRRVDEGAKPGSFLLTGSADPHAVQAVRDSLAGRLAMVPLRPLTWAERVGRPAWNPIDRLMTCRTVRDAAAVFGPSPHPAAKLDREVLLGGFPVPVVRLRKEAERARWHEVYVNTYIERDVPVFVRPDDISTFLRFVRLAAATTGGLVNLANLARDAEVSHDTARRWLDVLRTTYVIETLFPWGRNIRHRLAKAPKVHMADTGLAAGLLGIRDWTQADVLGLAGGLVESWVWHHLAVFASVAARRCDVHTFRTREGDECDFVLEGERLIPIEVKSSRSPSFRDTTGLLTFLDLVPKEAPFGLLLYRGETVFSLGDRVLAVPMSAFLAGERAPG